MTPTLTTERLVLRTSEMADFAACAAFLATVRARYMDGPHGRDTAWDWFRNDVAQWVLLDMGALTFTLQGRALGQVAVCHGPNFPEPELGWLRYSATDQGRGYAIEAAAAQRGEDCAVYRHDTSGRAAA